jgi:hypothetical protein
MGKLQAILTNIDDLFGAQVFLLDLVIEIILPDLSEPDLGRFYPLSVKQLDHLCTDDSIMVFSHHFARFHLWLLALIIGEIEHKLKPTNQEELRNSNGLQKQVVGVTAKTSK